MTDQPCDVCGHHSSVERGPVDFMGATAERLGITMGNYHYTCALAQQAENPDPYPVGQRVTVLDHDRETILGPYLVVRSYWPKPCVELLHEHPHSHMVRQHHDRILEVTG